MIIINSYAAILLAPLWIPLVPVVVVLRLIFLAMKPLLRHVGYFDPWETEEIDRRILLACMEASNDADLPFYRKLSEYRRRVRDARTWGERIHGIEFSGTDRIPLDPEIKERMDRDLGEGWDHESNLDSEANFEDDSDDEIWEVDHFYGIEQKRLHRGGILSASCSRPHDCVNGHLVELAPATTIFFLKDDQVYAVNREAQRRNPNLPTNDALCPPDKMEKWSRDLEENFLRGEANAERRNEARS